MPGRVTLLGSGKPGVKQNRN